MKYCLTALAFLALALPLAARPLTGQVNLTGSNSSSTPATMGVVYVVPDTQENWLQLNGLAQRVGRWLVLSRKTALSANATDYKGLRDYGIAQSRLKGMINRLILTAQQKAEQTLELSETGKFATSDAPEKAILIVSAQATEKPSDLKSDTTAQITLAGWWFLRTDSEEPLDLSKNYQLYQIGIPANIQNPSAETQPTQP